MSFGVMDLVAPPPDRCSVSACAWVCDGRVCDEALTMFCLCPGSIAPGKPMSDEEERRVAWLTVSRAMNTRQVSDHVVNDRQGTHWLVLGTGNDAAKRTSYKA